MTIDDAERAIRLIYYYLSKVIGRDGTTEWDVDRVATGMSADVRDEMGMVREAIKGYSSENEGRGVTMGELVGMLADRVSEPELARILDKLKATGEIYSPSFDVYRIT